MAKSLTLQYSQEENCIYIIDGIQTTKFSNGLRGIPFKDQDGVVTPEMSILFNRFKGPIVDDRGYIHDVFFDPIDQSLRDPITDDTGRYCLLLLRGVLFFTITPLHGGIIRNVLTDSGRDVLVISSIGGKVRWGYGKNREIECKLLC